MLSASTVFSQLIYKIIAVFFSLTFGVQGLFVGVSKEVQTAPEDFTPVLRFAACSDIHLNGDPDQMQAVRFGELFDESYAYAETQEYKNLDAVLVGGDFATTGAKKEYEVFNDVAAEHLRDGTQLLPILGNHEFVSYRDTDASVAYDVFREMVSDEIDFHKVINGFHFIGVSYDSNGKKFTGKKAWLNAELKKATADDPTKPVFVIQHPAPEFTIYGSVNWGDPSVRTVLSKYPQVVDFSGHSHYCAADPRSIWQGEFTAVGCGSLSAFMGNLNYVEGDVDAPGKSGGFWIVEVDKDGNVLLKLFDIENHIFFEDTEYYLSDISKMTKRPYSWLNCRLRDTRPKFASGSVSAQRNENGNVILSFPDAFGYYEAEDYKITITQGAKTVWSDTVISDYVRAPKVGMTVDLGNLDGGSYTVRITAVSPYAQLGETLKTTIEF